MVHLRRDSSDVNLVAGNKRFQPRLQRHCKGVFGSATRLVITDVLDMRADLDLDAFASRDRAGASTRSS